eukprot:TRINITY_DN10274_c0_g1_i2.p1 TRINITY_DN10274_c0_g1~~TRINITY_DN10274_c0_g1_i2.p1  ORF type:complete len:307 (-),score=33.86 TRINITY_DN10274_c0_g1_i2:9-929(-)
MGMPPFRPCPAREKEQEYGESICTKVRYAAALMQGWTKEIDDAFIARTDIQEGIHLFGVFVGQSGRAVSRFAQRHFEDELLKNEKFKAKDYKGALEDTFLEMDRMLRSEQGRQEVFQLTDRNSLNRGESCAANVILIVEDTVYCANVGDSRTILFREDNTIVLTTDQSLENPEECARITRAGGIIQHKRINDITVRPRSLGILDLKTRTDLNEREQIITAFPDVTIAKVNYKNEYIFMGNSAIWGSLSNEDIVNLINGNLSYYQKDVKQTLDTVIDRILPPQASLGMIECMNLTSILITLGEFVQK